MRHLSFFLAFLLLPAVASAMVDGAAVYAATCSACHGQGIAGAPKFSDAAAWKPRIAQGMETLVKHAQEGFQGKSGFMPAKGGNASLSNAEVAAAVKYMTEAAEK